MTSRAQGVYDVIVVVHVHSADVDERGIPETAGLSHSNTKHLSYPVFTKKHSNLLLGVSYT